MPWSLNIHSVFGYCASLPVQLRLVPHTSTQVAFSLFSLFFLFVFFRGIKLVFAKSLGHSTVLDNPDVRLATRDLSKSRDDSSAVPHSAGTALASPRPGLFSSLYAMIASPIAARPFPVPEPPSALVERTVDVVPKLEKPESSWPVKQPYNAFLVLDVEATCREGTDFNWPNEIIVSCHCRYECTSLC